MEQLHVVRAATDCVIGAALFLAGWIGWLDGFLPHFVTWGGAFLIVWRIWEGFAQSHRRHNGEDLP